MKMHDVVAGNGSLNVMALIVTADKFEDMELFVPYFRLLDEGATVHIAAPTTNEIGREHGYAVMPDCTIESVDPDA